MHYGDVSQNKIQRQLHERRFGHWEDESDDGHCIEACLKSEKHKIYAGILCQTQRGYQGTQQRKRDQPSTYFVAGELPSKQPITEWIEHLSSTRDDRYPSQDLSHFAFVFLLLIG